jgi:hypothetical protein
MKWSGSWGSDTDHRRWEGGYALERIADGQQEVIIVDPLRTAFTGDP